VQDLYIPIDDLDAAGKPDKRIGALRVIMFLEDLGDVRLIKKKEAELGVVLDKLTLK